MTKTRGSCSSDQEPNKQAKEPKEKMMTLGKSKPEHGSPYGRSIALAIIVSLMTIQAASGASTSNERQTLTGNWVITVTRTNPPPGVPPTFLSLQTYFADGSFLEESNTPAMFVGRGLAHGDWEKTGHRQFTRSFLFFRFDASRNFIGTQTSTATITLSEDGQTFEAEGDLEIFDVDGNLILAAHGTETGKRL